MAIRFVTFSIILDDIVLADGRTYMAMLGGGGPQTCYGARLFLRAGEVGIASGVGVDFDRSWFETAGIDLRGLRTSAGIPSMRAWQLIDHDERRTQVWRVPMAAVQAGLDRSLALLPTSYLSAESFHLGVHPDQPDIDFLQSLRQLPQRPLISVEVFKGADRLPDTEFLASWLSLCDVFSANSAEALSMGAPERPQDAARWLVAMGAKIAILRMGSAGSLVCRGDEMVFVAALPVRQLPIGAVGAGNAYCGGFVAAYLQHGNLQRAGEAGALAAKLLIEKERLPVPQDGFEGSDSPR